MNLAKSGYYDNSRKGQKAQLIKEFEKYIQTLSVDANEINRKELFWMTFLACIILIEMMHGFG